MNNEFPIGKSPRSGDSLLDEQLDEFEALELIRLITADDLHLDDRPRLKDICEATGRDPMEVAALLLELRKSNVDRKVQEALAAHDDRIAEVERLAREKPTESKREFVIEKHYTTIKVPKFKPPDERISREIESAKRFQDVAPNYIIVVGIILLLGIVFGVNGCELIDPNYQPRR